MRVVSPRTWLRITTREQTLIDTLIHPVQCGGEAVVLEAWEVGTETMDADADRMADHLEKINREDFDRRVGAMLDLVGTGRITGALGKRLETFKNRLKLAPSNSQDIPLLAGFNFRNWNPDWKVQTP
jgi:predicted transcriptional regulator of viral defense system